MKVRARNAVNSGHCDGWWNGPRMVASVEKAIRDELEDLAKTMCSECNRGDKPRHLEGDRHFVHDTEAGELGCTASLVHVRLHDTA